MRSSRTHRRGVGKAMRRLSPPTAALILTVLAILLLAYIFGSTAILPALLWAWLGVFVGWLGSLALSTDTQEGILFDIFTGGVGAFSSVMLFGGGGAGLVEPFLASIVGSVSLVAITGLVRSGWRLEENSRHALPSNQ